ncbi:tetratricopeptide repeat protein [Rhabdaerophilum sp. SD176]|uniref:tetratricopeptide repeat protein n=1 Tax=Rhabdaerophilum sp. SD176 TaxID=2983548 RepID=UPI0024E02553|nr:tetratricopeptide repeat protein [Rhabdaerophilum sp. SD176]
MSGIRQIEMRGESLSCERALTQAFLAHGRETPALLQQWLDNEPASWRAHATKAMMLTLLAKRELRAPAQDISAQAVDLLPPCPSAAERAFVEAASAAAHGAWWAAIDQLEAVIRDNPADTLAIKLSHAFRFMLGDKPGMLRSIERALRALPEDHPDAGFMLGCHAFALEENGQYATAERVGRRAVAMEARDAWGLHAVSHVHEMTGRVEDGIRWIEGRDHVFGACNNFGGHLFWHLALFKLEKGQIGDVLALYDEKIRSEKTDDFRDIANAASLLSRLGHEGVDVGSRWEELADKAEARLDDRSLVFADLHYLLALLGAGRQEAAARLADSLAGTAPAHASQGLAARQAGRLVARGLIAFRNGRTGEALDHLLPARASLVLIGGSDAQRDVFEQVLIESALRSGESQLARSILSKRLAERGGQNRFASERLGRLMQAETRPRGILAVAAALAFAQPAH